MVELRSYEPATRTWPLTRRRGELGRLRGALADILNAWGWEPERVEAVVLVMCEIVTNAHRHTHGRTRLLLTPTHFGIRLGVHDPDHTPPRQRDSGPETEGGFGLHILDTLARIWGVEAHPDGKIVWAEIDRANHARTRPT